MYWQPPIFTKQQPPGPITIKRKRYALEAILPGGKINIYRHTFRKNLDNFIYDVTVSKASDQQFEIPHKRNALHTQAPRNVSPRDYASAFGTTGLFVAAGDSLESCSEHLRWVLRRHKGLGGDNMDLEHRIVNQAVFGEVVPDNEIRVFELYHYLKHHFPHWEFNYFPDLSPYLCFRRKQEASPREQQAIALSANMVSNLTPLERATYDLMIREASEDMAAIQMMRFASATVEQAFSKTGRQCVYVIDASHIFLHKTPVSREDILRIFLLKDDADVHQAWTCLMPILHWFIVPQDQLDSAIQNLLKK